MMLSRVQNSYCYCPEISRISDDPVKYPQGVFHFMTSVIYHPYVSIWVHHYQHGLRTQAALCRCVSHAGYGCKAFPPAQNIWLFEQHALDLSSSCITEQELNYSNSLNFEVPQIVCLYNAKYVFNSNPEYAGRCADVNVWKLHLETWAVWCIAFGWFFSEFYWGPSFFKCSCIRTQPDSNRYSLKCINTAKQTFWRSLLI